jgi:hypothetical protein
MDLKNSCKEIIKDNGGFNQFEPKINDNKKI